MGHAILSPSGASRWMACTRSARLEQQFPDRAGKAAEEGTLAHELAEIILLRHFGRLNSSDYQERLHLIVENPLYDMGMREHIDEYVAEIIERFAVLQAEFPDALIMFEQKLDLTEYIEDGFGTSDIVMIGGHKLVVSDLKFGKGVPVFAENNPQAMTYALGALERFSMLHTIDEVEINIHQPRIHNFNSWTITAGDLQFWGENELKVKAKLAFAGEGEFNPGKACTFCRAKAVCKANADYQLQLAQYGFMDATLLTPEETVDIIKRADEFEKWLKAVRENALFQAVNNDVHWPGMKLVEGRSVRVIADESEALKALGEAGYATADLVNTKIKGIGDLEKIVGKSNFPTILGEYVIKPPGKPALVPVEDKRPEFKSADSAMLAFEDEVDL